MGVYCLKQRGESPQGTLQKEGGVMRTPTKIITALALAGLAVAGGSAFTAAGLGNSDTTDQFIGGTVAQSISGADLVSVAYDWDATATTGTVVDKVTVEVKKKLGDATEP